MLSKKKYYRKKCKCKYRYCDCLVGGHRDWRKYKLGEYLEIERKKDEIRTV